MDGTKLAAAMLLLCSSALAAAAEPPPPTTGKNPSNSANKKNEINIEQFRVPKNKRCTFERALCVVDCTKGSGPGKPDPPTDLECNKRCRNEIICNDNNNKRNDGSTNNKNGNGNVDQFADNKSFAKKLLCAFERAICLVSCGQGSPVPELPAPYMFNMNCMSTCSEDVICR